MTSTPPAPMPATSGSPSSTSTPGTTSLCVVGLGYIGLPTSAVLASRGYTVHGVEINPDVVATINSGQAHIVEPELDILVRAAVESGRLEAHTEPVASDIFIICVPTPLTADKKPDLSYVWAATRTICPFLREGNLVILESTSPPETTEEMARIIEVEAGFTSDRVHVAHAPERVLPGRILREVVENPRIVGGVTEAATDRAAAFYETFVSGEVYRTDARTAETVKLVENAFRDVNIAFANELSLLADRLNLDIWELLTLANRHPRVNILTPGPGVGGHCIAVDPWFLVDKAPDVTPLIQSARAVNDGKPHWVLERVKMRAERFKNPRIACLGLAYKADVDDLRESPAVEIVRGLKTQAVGELRVVEPYLDEHPDFDLCSLDEALADADIVLLLVGHRPFKRIAPKLLEEKIIIDVCGALL